MKMVGICVEGNDFAFKGEYYKQSKEVPLSVHQQNGQTVSEVSFGRLDVKVL